MFIYNSTSEQLPTKVYFGDLDFIGLMRKFGWEMVADKKVNIRWSGTIIFYRDSIKSKGIQTAVYNYRDKTIFINVTEDGVHRVIEQSVDVTMNTKHLI